jgi:hypothetical protein
MQGRGKVGPWLQRAFAAAVLIALCLGLVDQWPRVEPHLRELGVPALAGALASLSAAQVLSLLAWRTIVTDLGSPLPLRQAARIFFVGQVGKYVPGSVWPVLAQMEMGREAGVPRTRMAVSFVVTLLMSVVVGLGIGLPTLVSSGQSWVPALVVVVLGVVVAVRPGLVNAVIDRGLRLVRRTPLEHQLSRRAILRCAGIYVLCWLAFGLHLWFLAVDVGADAVSSLPYAVAAFAVAANLGTLFVLAPAGAGVREVLIVLGLAPVLASGPATAAALVSRLLVTVTDVGAALVALVVHRRHRAKNPVAVPPEPQ